MNDDDILAAACDGFLDEAREMLRQFEEALLAMEADPDDAEATNTAFRAAHTIKGTAGLFGYDAVVGFTHEVESLMEDLRSGSLGLSDAAMAALLQGRDQMCRLIDAIGGGAADPALAERSAELGHALRVLRGVAQPDVRNAAGAKADACQPNQAGPGGAAPAASARASADPSTDASTALPVWHVSLRLGIDALRNGLDPLSFIRYLGSVGTVQGIRTWTQALPALDLLDPENCHLGFEVRLATAAGRAAIEQVFEFLADDCELDVLAPDATPDEYARLLDARAADPAARDALLVLWQQLAGPDAPNFNARPAVSAMVDAPPDEPPAQPRNPHDAHHADERRQNEPERRVAGRDRRGGEEARFIRVRADKLDALIDLIGELVIAGSAAQLVAKEQASPRFAEAALRIHDLVQSARDGALGLRMVPIGETFARFQRVVRDVSKQLGKDAQLQITGGDTELDKSMVDTIADPLMHLVRNSLDHGLETPAERLAAGKPVQCQLALHAYHESGAVMIEVSDDGRGLNRERILAKAVERDLIAADTGLADAEVYALIFQPGFSTAEQVTNLSGRGVGMDVVKRNVEALRGQIKVASTPGRGTTMQIRLPLTLAIIDGFLTSVAGVSYVLPLDIVAECIELPGPGGDLAAGTDDPMKGLARARAGRLDAGSGACGNFDLRGELLPTIDMRLLFGHEGTPPPRRSLIVVRAPAGPLALLVDRLHGEYQAVIKPLGSIFRGARGIAGSTILGSGEVALILDVAALERHASALRHAAASSPHPSSLVANTGRAAGATPHPVSAPEDSHV